MYKESETIELKQELNKNIKKEIVAFANSKGGTIYIGITDDGKIKGLDNIDDDIESLSGMIRDGIVRNLTTYTNIEPKNVDGKDIIELHITSAPEKPYYLADKGLKPSGVYIRHGSSSIQASDEIIRKMMIESSERNFEEEISKEQNLTFNYAKTIFDSKKIEFSENKYKSLKMITDGKYNNLALLLSDQNPYTIKCAIFQGTNKTIFGGILFLIYIIIMIVITIFYILDYYLNDKYDIRYSLYKNFQEDLNINVKNDLNYNFTFSMDMIRVTQDLESGSILLLVWI